MTSNVNKTKVDPNVYNGRCKMLVQNHNFMSKKDVEECMDTLVNKKCEGFDRIPLCCVSFENVHKISKKCTPKQIMLYQISLKLYKVLNDPIIKTETINLIEQSVFTRRQCTFEIIRDNSTKIGINTAADKFYHITKMIGLDKLNFGFVRYKKIMKMQFLKYGNT